MKSLHWSLTLAGNRRQTTSISCTISSWSTEEQQKMRQRTVTHFISIFFLSQPGQKCCNKIDFPSPFSLSQSPGKPTMPTPHTPLSCCSLRGQSLLSPWSHRFHTRKKSSLGLRPSEYTEETQAQSISTGAHLTGTIHNSTYLAVQFGLYAKGHKEPKTNLKGFTKKPVSMNRHFVWLILRLQPPGYMKIWI